MDIEAVRNGTWPETQQLKVNAETTLSRTRGARERSINEFSIFFSLPTQCYMYCLWEQFGLVDDKRDLSLNGMLTFFHRIPAYRAEVQKAISKCKGIGKYFGIYRVFDIFIFSFSSIDPATVRFLF